MNPDTPSKSPFLRAGAQAALGALLLVACGPSKVKQVPSSLSVSPDRLDFKVIAVGQTAQATVALKSETPAPVTLASVAVGDSGNGDAAAFHVTGTPISVAAEGSAALTVAFTPPAVRSYRATLTIRSDDPVNPTQQVTLTGTGAQQQVVVALEAPAGCTATLTQDAGAPNEGLGIDFGVIPQNAINVVWPNLLIENEGGVGLAFTGARFASDGGAFYFPQPPQLPQPVQAKQVRQLPIAFRPPASGIQTRFSDTLTLSFDDPHTPQVSVALAAQAALNQGPVICAGIAAADETDGTTQRAAALRDPVPVEPGSIVHLTAFADDVADAGTPACTYDPEDGRTGLTYRWSVTQAPAGSRAAVISPTRAEATFIPDWPGRYVVHLSVTDQFGVAGMAAQPGEDDVAFDAAPLEDLLVRLTWLDQPNVDLDLHLVRPGGQLFNPGDDLYTFAADGGLDWGTAGDHTDDPRFSGDDQGSGSLVEWATLNRPQDGCLPDGGCTFQIWAHYYQDHRADPGAAACSTATSCHEGDACGCAGPQQACEPNGTQLVCAEWVRPTVEVYFKGQTSPALSVPLSAGPAADLPSPCFAWHAADVAWPASDGGSPVPDEILDGGAAQIDYWGDHTDGTKQCVPGTGGVWSEQPVPPMLQ